PAPRPGPSPGPGPRRAGRPPGPATRPRRPDRPGWASPAGAGGGKPCGMRSVRTRRRRRDERARPRRAGGPWPTGGTRPGPRRPARKLPSPPDVLELDVTDEEQVRAVADQLSRSWGTLDGILHAIGFAPAACLGNGVLEAGWEDVAVALQVSAYSLKALAGAMLPLLR